MAGYKGHIAGGIILMMIVLNLVFYAFTSPSWIEIILYMLLAIMFALWPDVDIKSKGQKLFYILFFITDLYLIIVQKFEAAAFLGLFIIIPILSKHRGWTHSIPAMILIPSPILIYPMISGGTMEFFAGVPYYFAAITGYFSHILLDKK